ncbi:MAG: hypothetical protein Aurels2KO_41420 [Aureliella sp.]
MKSEQGESPASIDFQTQIRPLLSQYCFTCHGPDEQTREADLRLDIASEAARVIEDNSTAGHDRTTSELGNRISTTDEDLVMPPPSMTKQPTESERQLLMAWLKSGGEMTRHWSFESPTRPQLPSMDRYQDAADWVRNPIDMFVLARMAKQGLSPSPRASDSALLRRIAFALTGLPPDGLPSVRSGTPLKTNRYVDRIINSPAYGEHMAFSWLEAARYADTDGYQNDRYRYQSAWRDWVIRAFDSHMPYDQFVTEQLAGDLLPNTTLWQQVATGFGRNHRINSEDGSIEAEWRVENVVDRVDTLGTVFLGLTIGCARCHDHKYDPISQNEYYQLFAYFNSIAEYGVGPNNGNTPPFIELPKSWPWLSEDDNRAITPDPVKLSAARKEAGNGLRRPQPGQPGTVMVMHELANPRETYRLDRGQYDAPDKSAQLSPGVPEALSFDDQPPPASRLELAQWLVRPGNPLTARVAVNRIWQQLFGRGLVETSENFGSQGNHPSHPQLLDWLACELVDSGWSLQHIQRLIIDSATFQQTASVTDENASEDTENRWLARGPRVRFTAAEVRDMALASSGLLVHRFGGESVKPYMPPKIWSAMSNNKYKQDSGEKLFRRSLYTYWRRTIPPPTMVNFNAANRELCSVRNAVTNTPLQALTLLNNKTFVEAARNLAQLMHAGGKLPSEQISFGAWRVLGRELSQDEMRLLLKQYTESLEQYAESPELASQLISVGESPNVASTSQETTAELAALSVVASILYNTDEAIMR